MEVFIWEEQSKKAIFGQCPHYIFWYFMQQKDLERKDSYA